MEWWKYRNFNSFYWTSELVSLPNCANNQIGLVTFWNNWSGLSDFPPVILSLTSVKNSHLIVLSFEILVLPKTVWSIWYVFFVDFAITTYKSNNCFLLSAILNFELFPPLPSLRTGMPWATRSACGGNGMTFVRVLAASCEVLRARTGNPPEGKDLSVVKTWRVKPTMHVQGHKNKVN